MVAQMTDGRSAIAAKSDACTALGSSWYIGLVRLLCCVLVLISSAFADSKNQVFSDFTTPLPLPRGGILVLGIVGGWERWDAPQRAIRRTALELRSMHLPRVWVETVENHKLDLAQELVTRAFDFDKSGQLDPPERAAAQIVVYGQSLGGSAALRFCRWLNEQGIRVRLAVVIDAYGHDPYTVPPNVAVAANLYQHDFGPVKGAPQIAAEDPGQTRILGNWRYTYEGREIDMPGEPAVRKWFMGSHLKMEYDPEPWRRVTDLLLSAVTSHSRSIRGGATKGEN
jgi:hypothetical protein